MALTVNNDTAIHEAGHCIISYLSLDLFEIEFVTANSELSKTHDSKSVGGLKGVIKKELDKLSFQDHDLMILTCLAGMSADDINHCECILDENLYDNSVFAEKMNSKKYSGDSELLKPHLTELVNKYNVNQRPYTISCQRLLNETFATDWIKDILIEIRNKIINSQNKTMQGSEINNFLDTTELKNWRENYWMKIIESRVIEFNGNIEKKSNLKPKQTWFEKFFDFF